MFVEVIVSTVVSSVPIVAVHIVAVVVSNSVQYMLLYLLALNPISYALLADGTMLLLVILPNVALVADIAFQGILGQVFHGLCLTQIRQSLTDNSGVYSTLFCIIVILLTWDKCYIFLVYV
jgi:hypothetical protein